MPKTLLDEPEEIDKTPTEGEATPEQENRGEEIVRLANATPKLLFALQMYFDVPVVADTGCEDEPVKAIELVQAAIAEAIGGAS